MRVLALDIGEKRTGIAVSDPQMRVATPVCMLPSQEVSQCARTFQDVLDDWEPGLLLCGLPRTLSGEEGPQAERIRRVAADISKSSGIECAFADERLSSREAKQSLRDMGYDEKRMRGKVDMIAASLFLQSWLDAQTAEDE